MQKHDSLSITRQHSPTSHKEAGLSLDSSFDDILVQLYQCASQGFEALAKRLKAVLKAQTCALKRSPTEPLHCLLNASNDQTYEAHEKLINLHTSREQAIPTVAETIKICDKNNELTFAFYEDECYEYCLVFKFKHASFLWQLKHHATFAALATHIPNALQIAFTLQREKDSVNAIYQTLYRYPVPIAVIDEQQHTVMTNNAMTEVLSATQKHAQHNQLADEFKQAHLAISPTSPPNNIFNLCANTDQRKRLKNLLNEAFKAPTPITLYTCFNSAHTNTPIILRKDESPLPWQSNGAQGKVVWLYVLNKCYGDWIAQMPAFIQSGLSVTEQKLYLHLFEGGSLDSFAKARQVSKQTVRKQLQSLLRKFGLESQEMLIKHCFEHYVLTNLSSSEALSS
ncbi:MAG: hypothetical protein CUN55_13870 [Phototrophicales bacterium]|nr:MAG: hypothetical protein CUN55_13870 [Phototrophicales bacterium]